MSKRGAGRISVVRDRLWVGGKTAQEENPFRARSAGPSHATRACERVSPAIARSTRKPNAGQGRFPF